MNTQQMQDLLQKLSDTKFKLNGYFSDDPVRPRLRPPASGGDLAALDAFLQARNLVMPASYRLFLSTSNGVSSLMNDELSLLSALEVARDDHGLLPEMVDEYPACSQFVIGAGNTPECVSFDVDTSPSKHGYEVVWISSIGEQWRHDNFEAFLKGYLSVLERRVAAQQKDRKNLKP
ncbi:MULTISPECIES: SMI1/KNR4 family protein [unclassified Caballeronia]|uniref:SMI1/KNR4 family protein n=1 Tax=unclassified Caballeronia TaxID=2646786 RepID=UPI0020292BDC|nr:MULTISPECIES: SMI1/KNR4 family protein [unclassified Caballeronia]MDR5769327.1 SMI1/KNR4 family protein [Caballeronia sp. LZ028]